MENKAEEKKTKPKVIYLHVLTYVLPQYDSSSYFKSII